MVESFDEKKIAEYLIAFADGELDAALIVPVAGYIAAHPEALEIIQGQQNLRAAARRVVLANTPAVPQPLRNRVALMPETTESEQIPTARKPIAIADYWKMISAAAVIVLLLGFGAGYWIRSGNYHSREAKIDADPAIPPVLVADLTKVHVDCSRFAPQLHSGPFPTTGPYDGLAAEVEKDLHVKVPYPDLTSIGYSFVGAGPCRKPLENTVHLLYRSVKPAIRDTLSVFVQPYRGQVKIAPGAMTLAAGENAAHPMFVWKTDHVVYFLVTDEYQTAAQARDVIQVASSR